MDGSEIAIIQQLITDALSKCTDLELLDLILKLLTH